MFNHCKYFTQKELFCIPIEEGFHAILNTEQDTGIGVVDNLILEILHFCLEGHTSSEICNNFKNVPKRELHQILFSLKNLKVLSNQNLPPVVISDYPFLITWLHITNKCNLRCKYCYIKKSKEEMDLKTAKKSIDKLFQIASVKKLKGIHFKFTGGEATLNESILINSVYYIEKLSQKTGIDNTIILLTNGVYLSKNLLDFIREHHISISISMDGIKEYNDKNRIFPNGDGSFHLIEKTLELLISKNIPLVVLCTITPENIENIPDFVNYLIKKKVYLNLSFERSKRILEIEEKVIETLKRVIQNLEKNLPFDELPVSFDKISFAFPHETACLINHNFLVINQNGDIPTCQMNMDNICSSIDSIDPFNDLNNSKNAFHNVSVNEKDNCKDCKWKYWCAGGCPLLTKRLKGTVSTNSPFCKIYKEIIPLLIRLEGMNLLKNT